MKKFFGLRMSNYRDIIASLPMLELVYENFGDTYNILSISQKCKDIIPYIKFHKKINEIKISDHYDNLGEKDYQIIKSCDFYINPKPIHPKELDWYNYRNLIQETCLMGSLDYKLINTNPRLNYFFNSNICENFKITIQKKFYDEEFQMEIGPDDYFWKILLEDSVFKNIKIDYINNSTSLEEKVNLIKNSNLLISPESDISWLINSFNTTKQINLVSNFYPNHINNLLAFAPPENSKNINLYYNKSDQLEIIPKLVDLIKNILYNKL